MSRDAIKWVVAPDVELRVGGETIVRALGVRMRDGRIFIEVEQLKPRPAGRSRKGKRWQRKQSKKARR